VQRRTAAAHETSAADRRETMDDPVRENLGAVRLAVAKSL
jgi:hypothetical protein